MAEKDIGPWESKDKRFNGVLVQNIEKGSVNVAKNFKCQREKAGVDFRWMRHEKEFAEFCANDQSLEKKEGDRFNVAFVKTQLAAASNGDIIKRKEKFVESLNIRVSGVDFCELIKNSLNPVHVNVCIFPV